MIFPTSDNVGTPPNPPISVRKSSENDFIRKSNENDLIPDISFRRGGLGLSLDSNLLSEADENEILQHKLSLLEVGDSENKTPRKKKMPPIRLDWDIDDLRTAILNLNEAEEIRTIRKLFREERR